MSRARDLASSGVTSTVLSAKASLASPDFTGKIKITGQSSEPVSASGNAGSIWYDSDINKLKVSNGTVYETLDTVGAVNGIVNTYTVSSTDYRSHTFLSSGVFTLLSTTSVDIFLVGGGGAGACKYWSGGGGSGGVLTQTSVSLSAGSYAVIVGAGGSAPSFNLGGTSGSPSKFHFGTGATDHYVAGGGLGGRIYAGTAPEGMDTEGNILGSSGGGSTDSAPITSGSQGNNGGAAGGSGNPQTGGGGGGAGGVGETGANNDGGKGGNGTTNFYRDGNTSGYVPAVHLFAAGGAGSSWSSSGGREGGTVTNGGQTVRLGGDGANGAGGGHVVTTKSALVNTGSGGGADGNGSDTARSGGNGGSGIVIIRYTI